MRASILAGIFATRARTEIRRYGLREWVFVRELIQNARDGGAENVWFSFESEGDVERLICRDDGQGMAIDEARRDLLTLYTSHKSAGRDAGRFGVGFWSILNFEPTKITIRSATIASEGWQLDFSQNLDHGEFTVAGIGVGTEVVLERQKGIVDVARCIRKTICSDAPFVMCKTNRRRTLQVFVDGKPVNRDFDLPAPSVRFTRRGLRGVVALAHEPRVEVFNHGILVRTATALDDLLLFDPASKDRIRSRKAPQGIGGLYPQVMLDSRQFDVLMNRGDLRENRALRRAVEAARTEVIGLVQSELDRLVPQTFLGRCRERLLSRASQRFWFGVGIVLAIVILGVSAGFLFGPRDEMTSRPDERGFPEPRSETELEARPRGYRNFGDSYGGPGLRPLGEGARPLALRYEPGNQTLYFAVWQAWSLNENGTVKGIDVEATPVLDRPYSSREAISVSLVVNAPRGLLRLPVPTGHIVDPDHVTLGEHTIELLEGLDRSPWVQLGEATRSTLRYRCVPAPRSRELFRGSWPDVPATMRAEVVELKDLPVGDRVEQALQLVASVVRYDVSPWAFSRFEAARNEHSPFFQALVAGVGDCDVQASLLVAVLSALDVDALMMAGWVGEGGEALPGMHAWVEYVDAFGRRRVADPTRYGEPAITMPVKEVLSGDVRISFAVPFLVAFALLILGLAVVIKKRARKNSFAVGQTDSLAELIRGALNRPEAFRAVPSLFSRPIVPLVDGRRISLKHARSGSAVSGLYVCRHLNELRDVALRNHCDVVDGRDPAGQVVVEMLEPIDLDSWQVKMDASVNNEGTVHLEKALAECGWDWRTVAGPEVMGSVQKLELGSYRILLVDEATLHRPDIPVALGPLFSILHIVSHGGFAPQEEQRILRAVAMAALES